MNNAYQCGIWSVKKHQYFFFLLALYLSKCWNDPKILLSINTCPLDLVLGSYQGQIHPCKGHEQNLSWSLFILIWTSPKWKLVTKQCSVSMCVYIHIWAWTPTWEISSYTIKPRPIISLPQLMNFLNSFSRDCVE